MLRLYIKFPLLATDSVNAARKFWKSRATRSLFKENKKHVTSIIPMLGGRNIF